MRLRLSALTERQRSSFSFVPMTAVPIPAARRRGARRRRCQPARPHRSPSPRRVAGCLRERPHECPPKGRGNSTTQSLGSGIVYDNKVDIGTTPTWSAPQPGSGSAWRRAHPRRQLSEAGWCCPRPSGPSGSSAMPSPKPASSTSNPAWLSIRDSGHASELATGLRTGERRRRRLVTDPTARRRGSRPCPPVRGRSSHGPRSPRPGRLP